MTTNNGSYVEFILPLPTSLKLAQAMGTKHYFTGKPCKRGHTDIRFTTGGCRTCAQEDSRRYYAEDPDKYIAQNAEWYRLNRDRGNELAAAYRKRNAHIISARARTMEARRLLRVPAWSETDLIVEFYKKCPPGHEVDHVLPLQGEFVSGLHVIGNLQYLTIAENRSKKNKWTPS
jgi:hypothetical protein